MVLNLVHDRTCGEIGTGYCIEASSSSMYILCSQALLTQPVSRTDILCPSLHPNPNLGMGLVSSPDLRGGHGYNVLLPSL